MENSKKTILVACVLVLSVSVFGNMIQNGSFDDGVDGGVHGLAQWTPVGGMTFVNYANQANMTVSVREQMSFYGSHENVAVLRGGSSSNGDGLSQVFAINDSDSFKFSFDFGFTNKGSYSTVTLNYLDESQNQITGSYFQYKFDWTDAGPETNVIHNNSSNGLVSMEYDLIRGIAQPGNSLFIPEETAYVEISLRNHYSGYLTYFDNLSFVPEPTTLGLFAIGSLLIRRKRK